MRSVSSFSLPGSSSFMFFLQFPSYNALKSTEVGGWDIICHQSNYANFYIKQKLFLFLFLSRIMSPSKGCFPIGHPYTRDLFLYQSLQADIGKRMLSSPPASLLPRYGRNRIRAGRWTKTRLKRVIQANVFVVRLPCQNQFIADSQQWTHIENPALLNVIDPDWDYWLH